MPLIGTRGVASSRGVGFLSVANIGGPYWIGSISSYNYYIFTTVDYDGNVYLLASSPGFPYDVYIIKYNSIGVLQWQKTWNTTFSGFSGVHGLSFFDVDNNGNIYFSTSIPEISTGALGFAIVKLNSSGSIVYNNFVQQYFLGSQGGFLDKATGEVYIVGKSGPTQELGFFIKFNASGVEQTSFETTAYVGSHYLSGVVLDSSKNIYVGGWDNGGTYVSKYNTSGTQQWKKYLSGYGAANDLAVDQNNNIYAAGFSGVTSVPRLLKTDSSGAIQWQRTLTGATGGNQSVAVDAFNNVYALGDMDGKAQITKYNSSGSIVWQRSLTAGGFGYSLKIDRSNNLYVGTNTSFAKLPSDGSLTGTYTVGSSSVVYASSAWTNTTTTDFWGDSIATDSALSVTRTSPTGTIGTASLTLNLTQL